MDRILVNGMRFVDEHGRERVFHGINVVCKDRSRGYVYRLDRPTLERFRGMGFNLVRLGVIWDGVEPEPGVYNQEYLAELEEQVRVYADYGIYVLLDMHQDLYGVRYADGAPEWATVTDGLPEPEKTAVWSDGYMSPAVQRAFDHFWANDPAPDGVGLQNHFAGCWRVLAERFKDRPEVLGYDLINEPFPGSIAAEIYKTLLTSFSRLETKVAGEPSKSLEELMEMYEDVRARVEALRLLDDEALYKKLVSTVEPYVKRFETEHLMPFYRRVARAVRSATQRGVILMEDCYFCNAGVPSSIVKLTVDGAQEPLQAFAPHVYDLVIDTPYYATHASEKRVKVIVESRRRTQKRLNMPVLVGEWGAFGSHRGIGKHCEFLLNTFDELRWSWSYWAWHEGFADTEAAEYLARPYPAAVAGELIAYRYDRERGMFSMEWVANPSLSEPTVVRLPRGLDWTDVKVEPECPYKVVEEDGAVYLEVRARRRERHVLTVE